MKKHLPIILCLLCVCMGGCGTIQQAQSWWERQTSTIKDFLGEPNEGEPVAPESDPAEPTPTPATTSPQSGSMTLTYKPKCHNYGKLVVLFPWKYRKGEADTEPKYTIVRAYIDGGDRDGEKAYTVYHPKLIEDGVIKEWRNGNRAHARWEKTGKKYGEDFKVCLDLDDGSTKSWKIKKGSKYQKMR